MSKQQPFTVTIQGGNLGNDPIVLTFDQVTWAMENGITRIYRKGTPAPIDLEPSGQRRMTLRCWSGCREFDQFVSVQDRIVDA